MLGDSPFVLVAIIVGGLLLGRLKVFGITLGTSGVLFAALLAGHLGFTVPEGVGDLGLVVFVFTVGLAAGRTFLRSFAAHGRALGVLAAVVVLLGVFVASTASFLFGVPVDLAIGVMAGAMTSTPALAAGAESLPADSAVAVGFGVGYPFGVLGVVLFVHIAGRVLKVDFEHAEDDTDEPRILRLLVEVTNPGVEGRWPESLPALESSRCRVARRLVGHRLAPLGRDFRLSVGQTLLVVGSSDQIEGVVDVLGQRVDVPGVMVVENERARVVVTSRQVVGRSLRDLAPLERFGVTVSRITRHENEFVPRGSDVLDFGDQLTLVGDSAGLEEFAEFAGHRQRSFDETDLISLGVGILLGVALGSVKVQLGSLTVSPGLAGGPLLVGLLMGHLQRLGPLSGHIPRAARMFAGECGLVIFLAAAGVGAGAGIVPVIADHGFALCLLAILVTVVPLVGGFLLATRLLKLRPLELLGGMCGGMTSTPGLGTLTSRTDSRQPVAAYSAAYPLALVLVVAVTPLAIRLLTDAETRQPAGTPAVVVGEAADDSR